MKHIKLILFVITLQFCLTSAYSQGALNQSVINESLAKGTIENQFDVLISKSPSFNNFKNIRQININRFTKNFKDSIVATNKKFSAAYLKIQNQKNKIDSLNNKISGINSDLVSVSEEKDSIGLIGMRMSKSSYNTILWSIILGLLAATLFLFFKFKSSNSITKQSKSVFLEIEQEFDTHKKNSLEREQVLRRQLQDEINKQRNVK